MPSLKIALALIACTFAACGTWIPPTPPEETAGYKAAGPVIAALERFRQGRGHYPGALRELVPHYIRDVRQIAYSSPGDDRNTFQYNTEKDRYSLTFGYFAGGLIEYRTYSSEDKKWHLLVVDP